MYSTSHQTSTYSGKGFFHTHLPPVDLEKDFEEYSFLNHYPEEKETIEQLFKKTIENQKSKHLSVSDLLKSSYCETDHLNLFEEMGFRQLNVNPPVGITLEHPDFPGWLIKKNYSFQFDNLSLKRNLKVVSASDFPDWMLPSHLKKKMERGKLISIKIPCDIIHPLRVVMLKRGKQCLNRLKLPNIQIVKEYLYLLPDADTTKPLYERVVVISKKVNILSPADHLKRIAYMAKHQPKKMTEIAQQVVTFIKNWQLTDAHLLNFRFLDDQTNTLVAIDGEPIGVIADASIPAMVTAIQSFDPGFYSLLGLKRLEISISEHMSSVGFSLTDIRRVEGIFIKIIDEAIKEVITERNWDWFQRNSSITPLISYISNIQEVLKICYSVLMTEVLLVNPV